MTTSRDPRSSAAVAPNSQTSGQPASRQQTPSQSYPSASSPPPPSTPPSPPPTAQGKNIAYISRVMASESRRRKYVQAGLQQLDMQESAWINGQQIPALDSSALDMKDFSQESSNEDAVERFCVWDSVEDPNVIYARTIIAPIEHEHGINKCQNQ